MNIFHLLLPCSPVKRRVLVQQRTLCPTSASICVGFTSAGRTLQIQWKQRVRNAEITQRVEINNMNDEDRKRRWKLRKKENILLLNYNETLQARGGWEDPEKLGE